jgi:hypothetical protein
VFCLPEDPAVAERAGELVATSIDELVTEARR